MIQDLATVSPCFVLLAISFEAGFRLGRRATSRGKTLIVGEIGVIQGALLGLLGLLLGFSFSGAAGRFMERQDLITQEANAIGTAYLRADVLLEPQRSELRNLLAEYVSHRIAVSRQLRQGLADADQAKIAVFHQQIWKATIAGIAEKPAAMVVVLPPVNELIDLHSTRVAAGRKHLPGLVLGLLIACSAVSMAVIGYGCGFSGRRCLAITASLALLIGAALWTTIDLDHPRLGLIRLDDSPLKELDLKSRG